MPRQEVLGTNWNTGGSSKDGAGDGVLAQVTQRLWAFLPGELQKLPGCDHGPLLWMALLEQMVGQMGPEVPANLSHVVILHDSVMSVQGAHGHVWSLYCLHSDVFLQSQ